MSSCIKCGSNSHSYTYYKYRAFTCNNCKGDWKSRLRCGECGRLCYEKEKPIPIEKNPINFIPGINIVSLIIHAAVEKSREGFVCSGCREDCRDCEC